MIRFPPVRILISQQTTQKPQVVFVSPQIEWGLRFGDGHPSCGRSCEVGVQLSCPLMHESHFSAGKCSHRFQQSNRSSFHPRLRVCESQLCSAVITHTEKPELYSNFSSGTLWSSARGETLFIFRIYKHAPNYTRNSYTANILDSLIFLKTR